MKKLIIIGLVLFVAGCATSDGHLDKEAERKAFEELCNRWIGRHQDDLVSQAGPPTSSYALSDGTVFQYTRSQNLQLRDLNIPLSCTVNFRADSAGIIRSYTYHGNACHR